MQALDYDRSTTGEKSWATMAEGEGEEGSPPQKEHFIRVPNFRHFSNR